MATGGSSFLQIPREKSSGCRDGRPRPGPLSSGPGDDGQAAPSEPRAASCPSLFLVAKTQCQHRIKVNLIETLIGNTVLLRKSRPSVLPPTLPTPHFPLISSTLQVYLLICHPSRSSEGHPQVPGPRLHCPGQAGCPGAQSHRAHGLLG